MAAQPLTLAVIVVSYNTRQITLNCLESVREELARAPFSAGVWVVDNASSDGSAEAIAAHFPPQAHPAWHLIRSETNLGFAGGTNLALRHIAQGGERPALVLFLNPDTVVQPGALGEMASFLQTHPRVGAVGAQLFYGDGRFQHGAFRFPTLAMAFFDFWTVHHRLLDSPLNGRYPLRLYAKGEPFPIDHPLGAAMMVRWEALEEVGWFDEGFFMYCEEIDWCLRAKAAGWEIYCVPKARIVHLGGQSAGQFREKMFVALWQSRYRLFAKHYGPFYRWAVRRIVRAGVRREMGRVARALKRGHLSAEEAECRFVAYHHVLEM